MSALMDRMAEIVADLESAGLRATADPDAVNPPTVYLEAPLELGPVATLSGGRFVTWELWVLAPPPANAGNLAALTRYLESVLELGLGFEDEGWKAGTKTPAPGLDPMPGYYLRFREVFLPTTNPRKVAP